MGCVWGAFISAIVVSIFGVFVVSCVVVTELLCSPHFRITVSTEPYFSIWGVAQWPFWFNPSGSSAHLQRPNFCCFQILSGGNRNRPSQGCGWKFQTDSWFRFWSYWPARASFLLFYTPTRFLFFWLPLASFLSFVSFLLCLTVFPVFSAIFSLSLFLFPESTHPAQLLSHSCLSVQ